MKLRLILGLIGSLAALQVLGQWQAVAGYDIAGIQIPTLNRQLDGFNVKNSFSAEPFKKLRILHSLVIGARYQHNLGALELLYQRGFSRRSADGVREVDSQAGVGPIDMFYNTNTISAAMDWGKEFVVGISLDYTFFKYKITSDDSSVLLDLTDEDQGWGSKIYLAWHLAKSEKVSFTVRPYYRWIWRDIYFQNVGSILTDLPELSCFDCYCSDCFDRPHTFGLSIFIHNGRTAR
ncbi:MAG: hypothetical protein OEQ53_12890 [Saprospiraceae bacterium]|nr:hypothetical protein [Saprospiraceae bacterium]